MQHIINKKCRWVPVSERNPSKSGYYIILRGEDNVLHATGGYPATHYWYAETNEWSSETKYWLEENID